MKRLGLCPYHDMMLTPWYIRQTVLLSIKCKKWHIKLKHILLKIDIQGIGGLKVAFLHIPMKTWKTFLYNGEWITGRKVNGVLELEKKSNFFKSRKY